jgi:hypothetical protein
MAEEYRGGRWRSQGAHLPHAGLSLSKSSTLDLPLCDVPIDDVPLNARDREHRAGPEQHLGLLVGAGHIQHGKVQRHRVVLPT